MTFKRLFTALCTGVTRKRHRNTDTTISPPKADLRAVKLANWTRFGLLQHVQPKFRQRDRPLSGTSHVDKPLPLLPISSANGTGAEDVFRLANAIADYTLRAQASEVPPLHLLPVPLAATLVAEARPGSAALFTATSAAAIAILNGQACLRTGPQSAHAVLVPATLAAPACMHASICSYPSGKASDRLALREGAESDGAHTSNASATLALTLCGVTSPLQMNKPACSSSPSTNGIHSSLHLRKVLSSDASEETESIASTAAPSSTGLKLVSSSTAATTPTSTREASSDPGFSAGGGHDRGHHDDVSSPPLHRVCLEQECRFAADEAYRRLAYREAVEISGSYIVEPLSLVALRARLDAVEDQDLIHILDFELGITNAALAPQSDTQQDKESWLIDECQSEWP